MNRKILIENEVKEMKLKMKYKFNKILVPELLNRKIEIEDEVTENECKMQKKNINQNIILYK